MRNYDKALDHASAANAWARVEDAQIAALNGQTYATLALVDLLRKKTTPPFISTDAMDGTFKPVKPGSSVLTRYFLVSHGDDAVKKIVRDLGIVRALGFDTYETAELHRQSLIHPNDYEVFRMTVEVVQP